MKKLLTVITFILMTASLFAQMKLGAYNNRLANAPLADDAPWKNDGGIRSVHVTDDLDGDGKLEILATDYTNGGRVHCFEYVGEGQLELVWSSPAGLFADNPNSTPRWVQSGDLDNDGNKEIIFPSGARYTGEVQVFEYKGNDNDYGTESILSLTADQFVANGMGTFRLDRERGIVYDFDGDGQSELIMSNVDQRASTENPLPYDQNVYILSINGDAPGFASWQVEGGDPNVHPHNGFSETSWWHSIPADIDGDGKIEIVNHYWNYYGFWSIDVLGPDNYAYPMVENPTGEVKGPTYYEFMRDEGLDIASFMGIAAVDVDGDGKDEIAGMTGYEDTNPYRSGIALISQTREDTGVYVWDDASKFSILKGRWEIGAPDSTSQFWGLYGADLNQNGKDEILVGGFYGECVVAVEYKGSGDIMDGANYDVYTVYGGEPEKDWEWVEMTIRDSAGFIDTAYAYKAWSNAGVMKMSHGDITGNGKPDLATAWQSDDYDSTKITYETWDGSAWVEQSVETVGRESNLNIMVLVADPGTGVYENSKMRIITPDDYILEQNYPNPFNPSTTIRFTLPLNKEISLTVTDMLGKEIKTLISSEEFEEGSHNVKWDGTNNANQKVASGNYIYTLKYGNFSKSVKMTLLK